MNQGYSSGTSSNILPLLMALFGGGSMNSPFGGVFSPRPMPVSQSWSADMGGFGGYGTGGTSYGQSPSGMGNMGGMGGFGSILSLLLGLGGGMQSPSYQKPQYQSPQYPGITWENPIPQQAPQSMPPLTQAQNPTVNFNPRWSPSYQAPTQPKPAVNIDRSREMQYSRGSSSYGR